MKKEDKYLAGYLDGVVPSPNLSQPDYLAWAEFVYGSWLGGACCFGGVTGFHSEWVRNVRKYAQGKQDVSGYRELIDCKLKDGQLLDAMGNPISERSILNINWGNSKFYRGLRNFGLGRVSETRDGGRIEMSDTVSALQKRTAFHMDKLAAMPQMKQLEQMTGQPNPTSGAMDGAMSVAQVDAFNKMNGYTLPVEIFLKDSAQGVLEEASFDHIRTNAEHDFWDFGIAAAFIDFDNGEITPRYADLEYLILPKSTMPDFSDIKYFGAVTFEDASCVADKTGMSADEIQKQIRPYHSTIGFNSQASSSLMNRSSGNDERQRNFSIPVLNVFVKGNVIDYYIHGKTRHGKTFVKKVDEYKEKNGMKTEAHNKQVVHSFKWVIGTDIIYDAGPCPYVTQGADGKRVAKLPIVAYQTSLGGITENAITHIDDLQIMVLKMRVMLSQLIPSPNLAVNMSREGDDLIMGGESYSFRDRLKMYGAKGILLLNTIEQYGDPSNSATNRTVYPLQTNEAANFSLLYQAMQAEEARIRFMTGINPFADASIGSAEVLNGVMQQGQSAMQTNLSAVIDGSGYFYTYTMELVARMVMYAISNDITAVDKFSVSPDVLFAVKPDEFYMSRSFNVRRVRSIMKDERTSVMQTVQGKMQEGLLSESDYFIIDRMLRDGDITKAQSYISAAVSIEKRRRDEFALQQEAVRAQAEAAAFKEKEAEKRMTIAADVEGKIKLMEKRFELVAKVEKPIEAEMSRDEKVLGTQLDIIASQSIG